MASHVNLAFLFLMVACSDVAVVAQADFFPYSSGVRIDAHGSMFLTGDLDVEEEMLMESNVARRHLGQNGYVSYGALKRGNVPCNQRGASYYNCRGHQAANPYKRACTKATRCARAHR